MTFPDSSENIVLSVVSHKAAVNAEGKDGVTKFQGKGYVSEWESNGGFTIGSNRTQPFACKRDVSGYGLLQQATSTKNKSRPSWTEEHWWIGSFLTLQALGKKSKRTEKERFTMIKCRRTSFRRQKPIFYREKQNAYEPSVG